MSSNPQHVENLNNLKALGFNVDEYLEDTYESWGYDEQVCMIEGVIKEVRPMVERIRVLEEALRELIDKASECDSWESFPVQYLDDANKALGGDG